MTEIALKDDSDAKDAVEVKPERGQVLEPTENEQTGFENNMDFQALWMAYSDLRGDYKDIVSMLGHFTKKTSPGNYSDYLKLQKDLNASKSLIDKIEYENSVLTHSNDTLVKSLEKVVNDESVLKVIRNLRLSLEAKRDVCVGYAKEKQHLEEKLGLVEHKLSSIQSTCVKLEEQKIFLENQVSQLKEKNDMNTKPETKWNDARGMSRSKSYESGIVVAIEADLKRKKIDRLEFKIDALENENEALKIKSVMLQQGAMTLKDALSASKIDGENKNKEIEKLKAEVKGINEKAADDINFLNKRIIELSMEKEMMKKDFESKMDTMIEKCNDSNEQVQLLEGQVVDYVKSTNELNNEISVLKKTLNDELVKSELAVAHNSELESELAEKNMEINVMKNEIIELKSQNEVMTLNMSDYAAAIEEAKRNEQKYQMELAKKDEEMEIKEKHFNAKLDAMNEDLRNRESLIEKNESILFEEQERARKLQERVNDLEQRIVERNILIVTKDVENINLRKENDSVRNELIDVNKEKELL
ncbi:hypothetical protein O9G_001011 [Rozella allomycis CSF55]|uniref:Uncharacterized protein n=1 Tax=Rozella allomycis (strain CSF55) TaxID=988480 RepID=A0A075AQY5_ROZAC|nr:hypothetical protein O9G_001011 [Rozella allomycis CSF55]|eukprot:EPZ31100.1 hypothetical protein O9G_001011 [Rozella allomycis CSF55]